MKRAIGKQKVLLGVLLLALAGLFTIGITQWLGKTGSEDNTASAEPTSPPSLDGRQESPEAVQPGLGAGDQSPSSGATESPSSQSGGDGGVGKSQKESAREALEAVVPQWASLQYGKVGTDVAAWADTWADDLQTSGEFESQSKSRFVELWGGVMSLDVNASVDTLKHVEMLWQQDNLSGWRVVVDRKLSSVDESGGVHVTETIDWEFTVEQQQDGSSRIVSFSQSGSIDSSTEKD